MVYNCLIIGLGKIGMGYDLTHNNEELVFSHSKALFKHPMFKVLGAVDPSRDKRLTFEKYYGGKTYDNISEALKELSPEIVIVSSPTDTHYAVLKDVLKYTLPKAVLCEKPLASNFNESKKIVRLCDSFGVKLFVNYHRRSDPGVINIKDRILSGNISEPIKGLVWYSKGFLHNGSHFLNLMEFWLGPVKKHSIISDGRLWMKKDPEPDIYIEFDMGSIVFRSVWEEMFSHYTAEIISPAGRIFYDRGGEYIQWQGTANDQKFDGYTILNSTPEIIKNDMNHYQYNVYQELIKNLHGEDSSLCTGQEALDTQETIQKIFSSLSKREK